MSQLQRTRRSSESPRTPRDQTSPTFEQLLRVEDEVWSSSTSPNYGMNHDQEESISPTRSKKSVLTKVKERAKKFTHSLSGKKKHGSGHQSENGSPPSWGVTLDDDDEDDNNELDVDPEYLGAPMYESEAAPEILKETARQHPRADPVVSEKHQLHTLKCEASEKDDNPISPNKTITETVSEKFAPAYAKMSDATHSIASKIAGLTVTTPEAKEATETFHTAPIKTGPQETAKDNGDIPFSPRAGNTVKKPGNNSGEIMQSSASSPQKWDKGVSVKEYFMNKLEPREDERALSQAITEAISPRKSPGDSGMVEKVKDAVSSFFWHEGPSNSMPKAPSTSPTVPVSSSNAPTTNAKNHTPSANTQFLNVSKPAAVNASPLFTNSHEVVEEENHGRILQAN